MARQTLDVKLKHQLLFISLVLLVIPWSGWQYLKVFDQTLRQTQAKTMRDQAALIAERLAAEPDLFFAPFSEASFSQEAIPQSILYAYSLPSKPIIDGYNEDWKNFTLPEPSIFNNVKIQVGKHRNQFYFFINVEDRQLDYFNPSSTTYQQHDHLRLTLKNPNTKDQNVYYLQASAPGQFVASFKDNQDRPRQQNSIRGVFRENVSGYQLEFQLEEKWILDGLMLEVINGSSADQTHHWLSPVLLKFISSSSAVEKFLNKFHDGSFQLSVLNQERWLIGSLTLLNNRTKGTNIQQTPWVIEWIYRLVLESEKLPIRNNDFYRSRLDYPELQESLLTGSALYWYHSKQKNDLDHSTLASVAAPITIGHDLLGFVLLEKSTDHLITLASTAFNRLFSVTLGAFLIVIICLLAYASWLSMRITRLNHAANTVVNDKGNIDVADYPWPDTTQFDEIGALSRNYRSLLLKVQDYNQYLRTLSNKLSHELRTPIAIVRSSLDNINAVSDPQQQQQYCQRAQQGVDRLSNILSAMSTAHRIEETVLNAKHTDFEKVDLKKILSQLQMAYNDIYKSHSIVFEDKSNSSTHARIVQDLFIQMLDKLIENAVDFSPENDNIIIRLRGAKQHCWIEVENNGSLLPDSMQTKLFDSMISLRNKSGSTHHSHLGLGLYIVRLIIELHKGEVNAQNKKDDCGVIFTITLPL